MNEIILYQKIIQPIIIWTQIHNKHICMVQILNWEMWNHSHISSSHEIMYGLWSILRNVAMKRSTLRWTENSTEELRKEGRWRWITSSSRQIQNNRRTKSNWHLVISLRFTWPLSVLMKLDSFVNLRCNYYLSNFKINYCYLKQNANLSVCIKQRTSNNMYRESTGI